MDKAVIVYLMEEEYWREKDNLNMKEHLVMVN